MVSDILGILLWIVTIFLTGLIGAALYSQSRKDRDFTSPPFPPLSEQERPIAQPIAQPVRAPEPRAPKFKKRSFIFTRTEMKFLHVLKLVLPNHLTIIGKVRLADIVHPTASERSPEYISAFNTISRKHVDFVVCNASSYEVTGVIELDDWTHKRPDRKARDQLVDEILRDANVKIVHIPVEKYYNQDTLKRQLEPVFLQIAEDRHFIIKPPNTGKKSEEELLAEKYGPSAS